MNKSENVKMTNELKNPSVAGIHFRLLCMTGPNKGKVYYLLGKRIIIGRGDMADIQIVDAKISREHAELSFADGGYVITDLGAQNGIIVNDSKVKQKRLTDSEKIVIGQTVFKFNVIEVSNSEVAISDHESLQTSLKDSKLNKNHFKMNSRSNNLHSEDDSNISDKKSNPKILIMGAIVLVVLFVLFDKDEPVNRVKPKNNSALSDFDSPVVSSKKLTQDDSESKKKLDSYIHSGRREFSEGNYFRAMEDFRLALLLSPNDGHASFYLAKAKQRLDEDIEKNFLKGKQEYESKKLQAAIVSYCGVVQLIQNYPNDERYKNALVKISAIESELGLEKGEVKCFEEKSADSKN